jgi:phosphatidylglycerophosphate synthase
MGKPGSSEENAMTGAREMTFLLAEPERRVLRAIAAKLPRAVGPNHLTALGVVGAVGAGVGYALSSASVAWLWLASAMLAVNWFGDSLDGTLARVRKAERPRYGYYLDHVVDAVNTTMVGLGLGFSPYVRLEFALILVIAFLTLAINVYLETAVFGKFRISYAGLGPTEGRIILILGNTLLFFATGHLGWLESWVQVTANAVVVFLSLGMFTVLLIRFGKNLRQLAKLEPKKA